MRQTKGNHTAVTGNRAYRIGRSAPGAPGRWITRCVAVGITLAGLLGSAVAFATDRTHGGPPEERGALRVCAQPNNMPFSNRAEEGFENRLAEMMAEELGVPLEYTWVPHTWGFLRATLRDWLPEEGRYRCDVIMGVPRDVGGMSTTPSYYHSTYVIVMPADGRYADKVESAHDIRLLDGSERRGMTIGAFDDTPAVDWLVRHGLRAHLKGFVLGGADPNFYAGQLIAHNLVDETLDMAIVWGPIGGYFAERADRPMKVIPMESEGRYQFDYRVSLGVRPGDHELLRPLQVALRERQEDVDQLIDDYNIPRYGD